MIVAQRKVGHNYYDSCFYIYVCFFCQAYTVKIVALFKSMFYAASLRWLIPGISNYILSAIPFKITLFKASYYIVLLLVKLGVVFFYILCIRYYVQGARSYVLGIRLGV